MDAVCLLKWLEDSSLVEVHAVSMTWHCVSCEWVPALGDMEIESLQCALMLEWLTRQCLIILVYQH